MLTVGILCGGFGTRMGDSGKDVPKALMEVAGAPILDHILESLASIQSPFQVLAVSNSAFVDQFRAWQKGPVAARFPVTVLDNGVARVEDRLGSIGDMHFTVEHAGPGHDLVFIGSDNLFSFSLAPFIEYSQERGPALVAYDLGTPSRASHFGVVDIDGAGRLRSFIEKPAHPQSSLIAACIYYFPTAAVSLIARYINEGRDKDKAGSLIEWMVQRTEVFGWQARGQWFDIGDPGELERAQELLG